MATKVDEWNDQYGDNEAFAKSSRRLGFDYELDLAYPVRIESAKVIQTARGEVCVAVNLAILERGEKVGSATEWITLPKQETDKKLSADFVKKLTFRRRDDLQRLLSSATNEYAVYVERKEVDGRLQYIGPNGNPLSPADFKERERAVNIAVMALCDDLHDKVGSTVDELQDGEFWIVKAPNKKSPDYPYTNIYNVRPTKLPVFGDEEAVA